MKTYKVKVNDKVYEVQVESVTESSEKIAAPAPQAAIIFEPIEIRWFPTAHAHQPKLH